MCGLGAFACIAGLRDGFKRSSGLTRLASEYGWAIIGYTTVGVFVAGMFWKLTGRMLWLSILLAAFVLSLSCGSLMLTSDTTIGPDRHVDTQSHRHLQEVADLPPP